MPPRHAYGAQDSSILLHARASPTARARRSTRLNPAGPRGLLLQRRSRDRLRVAAAEHDPEPEAQGDAGVRRLGDS